MSHPPNKYMKFLLRNQIQQQFKQVTSYTTQVWLLRTEGIFPVVCNCSHLSVAIWNQMEFQKNCEDQKNISTNHWDIALFECIPQKGTRMSRPKSWYRALSRIAQWLPKKTNKVSTVWDLLLQGLVSACSLRAHHTEEAIPTSSCQSVTISVSE